MLRRGYSVSVGKVSGAEVDFVAQRGAERVNVQLAYLLASSETINREFGVFAKVPDAYPRLVLTMDPIDASRGGVTHRNIIDWLLDTPNIPALGVTGM